MTLYKRVHNVNFLQLVCISHLNGWIFLYLMALRFTPTNVKDFGKNSVTTLYVNHAAILQVLGAICFSRVDIIYLLCIPSRLQKGHINLYPSKMYVFCSFFFFFFHFCFLLLEKTNSSLKHILTIICCLLTIIILFDIIYALQAQCLFKTIFKLFIGCFFVNLSYQS